MPHLNLQSGVPKVVPSGALVGATNFSEFPLGVGLPAGITAFGSTTSRPDPNLVEIGFDGEIAEQGAGGRHFAMTGRGPENWGYGLDSFFGQMDRGEMRVIIRSDYRGGFEDFTIGAAAGMEGATNALWRAWIGTQFLRGGVNDVESSGKGTFAGFGNTMFGLAAGDLQEPFIAGLQFNVRVRRIANVGDPSRDDWEVRSWYGGVGAEPVAPDATATNQLQTGAGLQAIGWGQLPQGPFNPVLQKIRFLSFSDNPLVEPAPDPSDIAEASVWVPSGNQLQIDTAWEGEPASCVPFTLNGAKVGFADFSEFLVRPGLPAGITAYGIGVGNPDSVAIRNDPAEGNYFEMLGTGGRFAFGLDCFDGLIESGELLARVWLNITTSTYSLGTCMDLSGFEGFLQPSPDLKLVGGAVRRQGNPGDVWDSVGIEVTGITTFQQVSGPMQEVSQNEEWMWIRIRRTVNLADPAEDDWQVTSWHGAFEDEPASVDVEVIGVDFAPQHHDIAAIGWFMSSGNSAGEQRIAYLSFTSDPLLAPPPPPPGFLTTDWVPS